MRKFRASMEPFWDLKIGKYVEYLMPVSSEYLISCELLSLTSTAGRTSRVFLADVIPWINKAGFELYIARHRAACHNRPIGSCTALSSSSLWLKHRNLSLLRSRVGLRLHLCDWGATVYAPYWWPFTTCTITTMKLLGTLSRGLYTYKQLFKKTNGLSRDGSVQEYTTWFVGTIYNIYYTSLCLLCSIVSCTYWYWPPFGEAPAIGYLWFSS
jgi:hypothetical protein